MLLLYLPQLPPLAGNHKYTSPPVWKILLLGFLLNLSPLDLNLSCISWIIYLGKETIPIIILHLYKIISTFCAQRNNVLVCSTSPYSSGLQVVATFLETFYALFPNLTKLTKTKHTLNVRVKYIINSKMFNSIDVQRYLGVQVHSSLK